MRSVAVSDLLKFSLLILSVLVLLPFILLAIQSKGPETFLGSLPQGFTDPFSYMSLQDIAVWCILLFFLPITSSPLYQRLFSSAPYVNAKKAILYCILLWMLIDTVVVFAGLLSVDYGQSDPDIAFITVGQNLLPAELHAIFFIGLIAAVMSAADSYLHAGASSLAHDVYKPLFKGGDRALVFVGRLAVVFLGAVSLLLAFYFQQIIPALIFTLTVWTAGILVPTLAALFRLRLSPSAAYVAILAGSLSALICRFIPITTYDPLLVGLLASAFAAGAVSIIKR
jgi:SSS family solute:Na+ symporter